MTKEALREYIKVKFSEMGFSSRRNYYYKIFDDDYLIGFFLDPSSYCKGYRFTCGIIYFPDEKKMPFCGKFDVQRDFIFPMDGEDSRDIYECIEESKAKFGPKNTIFEYENYTIEQLDYFFKANYFHVIVPFYDKEYGLQVFRSNWKTMNRFSTQNVVKLCKRAGLDSDEVLKFLGK